MSARRMAQDEQTTRDPTLPLAPDTMGGLADDYFRRFDDRVWHRFNAFAWDRLEPEQLSDAHRSALAFITFIEDHLPGYFAEYQALFPVDENQPIERFAHNRELYRFTIRWAQEEDRHAHVLFHYQVRAGLAPAAALHEQLAVEGRKPFHLEHVAPVQVFTYTLIQEKATQLFYRQFAQVVREPVLREILLEMARNEARHFAFFVGVVEAYIQEAGSAVFALMKQVVQEFKMPLASTLQNYWRWSLRLADTVRGYDHTQAYEELIRIVRRTADAATCAKAHDLVEFVRRVREL